MAKISYDEYLRMLRDPDTPEERILEHSVVRKGEGAFDPQLAPDPEKVEMTMDEVEAESAMQLGNSFARWRRQAKFHRRINHGEDLPVLVSEGDSWFQFPLLIKEVIDQLGDEYLIWSVGAAGDTAQNMIHGKPEYMKALRKQKDRVKGFLFSAAGNDIIGEDPASGRPVLQDLLRDFNGNTGDVTGHVNLALLGKKVADLRDGYAKVIGDIRAEPAFARLPIFIHGYDYVFPYPWGDKDPRSPAYAANDEWLGQPLAARRITDLTLRQNVLKFLIDALYDMMADLAGDSEATGVWLVDCRNAMPDVSDWNDEIHGTSDGFAKAAARFRPVIRQAVRSGGA